MKIITAICVPGTQMAVERKENLKVGIPYAFFLFILLI